MSDQGTDQIWYFAKNGQQFGPVTAKKLKALAAAGQLSPSDLVWKEGLADWRAAGSVKGLFDTTTEPRRLESKAGSSPPRSPFEGEPSADVHDGSMQSSRRKRDVEERSTPVIQPPPQVVIVQPPEADPRRSRGHIGFECPYCHTDQNPVIKHKISTAGWVLFVVLLLICFPLCIIALFVTEEYRVCRACGTKLG